MSEENKNIELWEKVEQTDPKYTKRVEIGTYKYTAIDAHYQILKATTEWGPLGNKWGIKDEKFTPIMTGDKSVASIIYTAVLYYPEGEFPINSDARINSKTKNGYVENKDYAKKASTDALTKGLSKLGFSADVFMGKFDGADYSGIESFVEKEMVTPEQMKILNRYIKDFEVSSPQTSDWVKKKIGQGLTKEQAEERIKDCEKAKIGLKDKK